MIARARRVFRCWPKAMVTSPAAAHFRIARRDECWNGMGSIICPGRCAQAVVRYALTMRFLLLVLALPLMADEPLDHAWQILHRGLEDGNPAKRAQDVAAMGVMRPDTKSV